MTIQEVTILNTHTARVKYLAGQPDATPLIASIHVFGCSPLEGDCVVIVSILTNSPLPSDIEITAVIHLLTNVNGSLGDELEGGPSPEEDTDWRAFIFSAHL